MKRLIISCVILVGLTALAVTSFFFVTGSAEDIIGKVELVEKSYKKGDYDKALLVANEAKLDWNKFYKHRHLIVDKEHVVEITSILSRLSTLAKEKSPDLTIECESAITMLTLFRDKQGLDLYNIL